MSGQWETVGRKKGKDIVPVNKKSGKDTKSKFLSNGPKVEEVLPAAQLKSLYSLKPNKENQKPQEKIKEKKPIKKQEKPQEPPKPKPPKSIESALNSIDVEEFKNIFEKSKELFPEAPLVWLKELAQFLNQKVPIEIQDPVFSNKNEGYPFSIMPSPLKAVMSKCINESGKSNIQLFFDMCLTTMAADMTKGLPALGHKFFIQNLALNDPTLVTNFNKHLTLKNSYQNRQNVGLSILWALGQAGIKDLNIGLKVFQEMMLSLIEMRNYSRYVTKYLINLINQHENETVTKEQYLLILDVVFMTKKNFPNDLTKDLHSIVVKLDKMLKRESALIEPLFKKLFSYDGYAYKNEICKVIVDCLKTDSASYNVLSKCYVKYALHCTAVLRYIDTNWKDCSPKLNKKLLAEILATYAATNEEPQFKKRKDNGLFESVVLIKKLSAKMAEKDGSNFPYKTLIFVLMLTVGGLVQYDIKLHGSWEQSHTFITMNDVGVFEYANKAVDRAKEGRLWLHNKIDAQYPGYYEKSVEILEPYVQVTKELLLVGYNVLLNLRNVVVEKYPVVLQSIESYIPGLVQHSQKAVQNVWSTSVLYFNRSVDYLKNEVFVGQLAPENVQRVVLEAINTTQQKACEYYHWLYEKVQSTIK